MEEGYIQDAVYDKVDFKATHLVKGSFENCTFNACSFYSVDISAIKFIDCIFEGCDLSLASVKETVFRDVVFRNCKMLGLRFDDCNKFGLAFGFEHCVLNNASFYAIKIKKTTFKHTVLAEVDFTDCDISKAVFDDCNLAGATFENTIMEEADFYSAYNYTIDPEKNRIKKARFSLTHVTGLLHKYNIKIQQ